MDAFSGCSNIELIFTGGQKKVYKVLHRKYGTVVVKVGSFGSYASLERIKREVDCLKEIDSVYFPKNYEFNFDKDSKEFYAIEQYIESVNLTEIMAYYNNEIRIIDLLKELVKGLRVLWDKNAVHRDLKPDNILITSDYKPVIIDLGIARFLDYDTLTKTLLPMGPCTPVYASPEQILNKKESIDIRTDFFSLGIITLELYLGYHPFHPDKVGNDKSIPINICEGNYINPNSRVGTTIQFSELIKRLLMPQPYQRFRNYTILSDYLKEQWR
jgi:eukaryotic-like serine/threonine-protein kinase